VGQRSDSRTVGLSLALFVVVTNSFAQAPNRATRYLFPTDVTDARALWVNPAGLGAFPEASINLDVTVGDPGSSGKLRQLTFAFNSRGLSAGYQRDIYSDGQQGHTYKLGLATGQGGFAAGLTAALYRGAGSGTGWDVGLRYDVTEGLIVGAAIQHIGGPHVRDSTLRVTYVPGATLLLGHQRVGLSALSQLTSDGAEGYAFGARGTLGAGWKLPVGLLARLDTDGSLRRTGFVFGVSLGGEDAAGLVATTPGDVSSIDALSLYGVSTRRFARPRPH